MNTLNLTEIREGFDADKETYWKMRDELLAKYRGKWVAIHKGRVVAVGNDLISIADEAIRDDGYAYTNKVGDEDKIIVTKRRRKFPSDDCKKAKTFSPRNAEYTEIRRKEFYSATLGDFGEVRRIIFSPFGYDSSALGFIYD